MAKSLIKFVLRKRYQSLSQYLVCGWERRRRGGGEEGQRSQPESQSPSDPWRPLHGTPSKEYSETAHTSQCRVWGLFLDLNNPAFPQNDLTASSWMSSTLEQKSLGYDLIKSSFVRDFPSPSLASKFEELYGKDREQAIRNCLPSSHFFAGCFFKVIYCPVYLLFWYMKWEAWVGVLVWYENQVWTVAPERTKHLTCASREDELCAINSGSWIYCMSS